MRDRVKWALLYCPLALGCVSPTKGYDFNVRCYSGGQRIFSAVPGEVTGFRPLDPGYFLFTLSDKRVVRVSGTCVIEEKPKAASTQDAWIAPTPIPLTTDAPGTLVCKDGACTRFEESQ